MMEEKIEPLVPKGSCPVTMYRRCRDYEGVWKSGKGQERYRRYRKGTGKVQIGTRSTGSTEGTGGTGKVQEGQERYSGEVRLPSFQAIEHFWKQGMEFGLSALLH